MDCEHELDPGSIHPDHPEPRELCGDPAEPGADRCPRHREAG